MAGPVSIEEIFQLNLKDKSTFGSLRKRRGGPSVLKESAYRCISSVAGGWEPMRTPKTLKIAEIQARRIAVDWESLGYNITRCHTFNVTICYHYFRGHNESKADCLDMDPKAPQHVVSHLPPYTNVSLKMILTNPEGRKESEETIIQTDEDGTSFENKIFLNWKEPLDPNGIITQYEVSYSSIRSFDPAVPVAGPPQTVSNLWNSTHHVFMHLHPGTTYQFFIRASTVKGFGPATAINVTTNISAPTLPDYEGVDASLNETATTITVLLRPAQAKGAPISAYQIVVEELHPHRAKREAGAMECYQVPVTYQNALSGGAPYYFAAELPPGNLPEPAPFTVGDNRTYQGFWNPPLAPRKGYNIYFQAMSSVEKDSCFLITASPRAFFRETPKNNCEQSDLKSTLVVKHVHDRAKTQWALFVSPETCLFTGEFTPSVSAHSFRYQRETGPAFLCQFGLSFSDFGSTSDEIEVLLEMQC
ncbi:hypothetical protein PANDA_011987 [Ailuropoda melanoleuca]|uniref:Fibronectin type-III domain-containing protein n=1 Tax=Ailuropoda melanoleuca TaxID=9646 RepID=D2HKQ8_AILME|nr:hypothetical protein PANDA_011987 [Ailuropoda melanoleuca]